MTLVSGKSSTSPQTARGPHGLRTSPHPCPTCGETGHEVGLVLGLRTIFCPHMPLGGIGVAKPPAAAE